MRGNAYGKYRGYMQLGQVLGVGSCIYFENAGSLCNLAWHFVFKVEEPS